jgi:hypothetical protein
MVVVTVDAVSRLLDTRQQQLVKPPDPRPINDILDSKKKIESGKMQLEPKAVVTWRNWCSRSRDCQRLLPDQHRRDAGAVSARRSLQA